MKKSLILSALFICFCIVFISFSKAGSSIFLADASNGFVKKLSDTAQLKPVDSNLGISDTIFDSNHLDQLGLSRETLKYAIRGYEKLIKEGVVGNQQYLSIADLSQSSRKKRFYVLDLLHKQLVLNTFVAHGRNSGVDEAENFSNDPNSNESSLGFYKTDETYVGKHGLSLRLDGLEQGFNDKAFARGIVVHAADYVNEGRTSSAYMGRSQGCPALPREVAPKVINMIKGGSVLFVFHPTASYLQASSLING